MNHVVVYEKTGTGWSAYVPDLSGVVTTGRTKEEVQRLIREAIEFHLEGCDRTTCRYPSPAHQPK